MPFKDPEVAKQYQRDYQRRWFAARRAAFFSDKECLDCGSHDDLVLDHRDPATKVSSVIWSWSAVRQEAEVAKCDVRCQRCHKARHGIEQQRHGLGRYQAGCRCDVCRAAKSAAMKRETRRQKAGHSKPNAVNVASLSRGAPSLSG